MSSVEVRSPQPQEPESSSVATVAMVAEELPPLSDAARIYLDELRQKLSPEVGYQIKYPGGSDLGGLGLTEIFPALTLELALDYLERYFVLNRIETSAACRKVKIAPVFEKTTDRFDKTLGLKSLYVKDVDGIVREI